MESSRHATATCDLLASPFVPFSQCDTDLTHSLVFLSLAGAETGAERDAGPGEPQRQPGKTHCLHRLALVMPRPMNRGFRICLQRSCLSQVHPMSRQL